MSASKRTFVSWLSLTFALLLCTMPAHGQFWETKDWRTWNQEECEKVLTDSPWARRFVAVSKTDMPGSQASRTVEQTRAQAQRPQEQQRIEYNVQLRSARPIREAMVRQLQIASNYDRMQPAQKQAFDKQANEYLDQDFGSYVVVHVGFSRNTDGVTKQMAQQWGSTLPPKVKDGTLLLSSGGDQVRFENYDPPEKGTQEFELFFPKSWEGKPTAVESDKRIQVQLPGVAFHEGRIEIDFDLRKMKYRGNLEY
jgi:hypothetical protein